MINDLENSMGNTELRLTLASLESEMAEIKSIAIDTHTQAKKTNGRVNWLEKAAYISMGALPLLTIWAAWLTVDVLSGTPGGISSEQLNNVLSGYTITKSP